MSLSGKCSDQCVASPDQDSAGTTKESWSQFMSRQLSHLLGWGIYLWKKISKNWKTKRGS
ncbi:conserved hypothetical protein [Ricinus communis]|uniref:Uncharacterized protein n=1 Tax=Ricinus communis TaxID=3988 RepID=B9S4I7_RICCO|nr:conserved hypothetical protein [Ricinus communis]